MTVADDELTFDLLDDIALAAARRRNDPGKHLAHRSPTRIGPLLELLALDRSSILSVSSLPASPVIQALNRACLASHATHGEHVGHEVRVGFVMTNRDPEAEDQTHWIAFCRKAQQAAELSLPKPIARGLIGAMREIEENVHIHSDHAHDGVVGYRGTREDFEFVVADTGIGILSSLQRSPDYAHLTGSGPAIQTALTDGQSRLRYLHPGHGYGFRNLFVGLANLNGHLRFRSGDHALSIDGSRPSLMTARLNQKVEVRGFQASVLCRPEGAVMRDECAQ